MSIMCVYVYTWRSAQAPLFWPFVGAAAAPGFSEVTILVYMPLTDATVTPGRGQWWLIVKVLSSISISV